MSTTQSRTYAQSAIPTVSTKMDCAMITTVCTLAPRLTVWDARMAISTAKGADAYLSRMTPTAKSSSMASARHALTATTSIANGNAPQSVHYADCMTPTAEIAAAATVAMC